MNSTQVDRDERLPVTVTVSVNGVPVPVALDERAIHAIAAAVVTCAASPPPASPFLTVQETAEYLRCSRQRIYDLLSRRRLGRVKEGARTLIRRTDVDAYLQDDPTAKPARHD